MKPTPGGLMPKKNKIQLIAQEIREFCSANADDKVVQKYARFFTEGYDAYGLTTEVFMDQKNKFNQTCRAQLSIDDALQLGDLLLRSGKYEEGSFAIHIILSYRDEFSPEVFQQLGQWLEDGIRNWAHTDVLCGQVLSIFFEETLVEIDSMASWRESQSKWRRRAVPVTLIEPLKAGRDPEPLLSAIEPLMLDEDRFVHQGLGWFLREAWKRYPDTIEAFLLKWKDTAPRKIFQYATEKMTQENKSRFRRSRHK
jgi:3-methyladenine DNA glycosylase AlkD